MARQKVSVQEAKAVRKRLKAFARSRFGSWAEFLRRVAPPRTTADAWSHAERPSVPDAFWLLKIAEKTQISLNWLLLGEGPELRVREASTPAEQVRAAVEAELRQSEDVTAEEFEGVWTRLMVRADWQEADEVVLRLAVEGVRARFQENLRLMRHYRGMAHIYNSFAQLVQREEAKAPARTARITKRFEELLNVPFDQSLRELSRLVERHKAEQVDDPLPSFPQTVPGAKR